MLDAFDASVAVVGLVVALIVIVKLLSLLSAYVDGMVLAKQTIAESVAELNRAKAGIKPDKSSKKKGAPKGPAGDDEPEPWEPLIEQLRPYQAMVKGYVQKKGWPVDVDKVFAYDEAELDNLDNLAELALKKGNAGQTDAAGAMQLPDWYKP